MVCHIPPYPCILAYSDLDIKSSKHIEGSGQRRAPTIQGITKRYNNLCGEIEQMVKHNIAPLGAVVPEQIPAGGLWALDVDDSIWQDIGLQDDSNPTPPLWLKDEKVCTGIQNIPDLDRCLEEESRLQKERCSLQELVRRQWAVLCKVLVLTGVFPSYVSIPPLMTTTDNPDMAYHINREVKDFTCLCFLWRQDCHNVPCHFNEYWGPPEDEMMISAALKVTSQVDFTVYEGLSPTASEGEEEAFEDEELYAQMEAVALRDEYTELGSHSGLSNAEYSSDDSMQASPAKKRPRHR